KIAALVTVIAAGGLALKDLMDIEKQLATEEALRIEHLEKVQAEIARLEEEARLKHQKEEAIARAHMEQLEQDRLEKEQQAREVEQLRMKPEKSQKSVKEQIEADVQKARKRRATLLAKLEARGLTVEDKKLLQDDIAMMDQVIQQLEKEKAKIERSELGTIEEARLKK